MNDEAMSRAAERFLTTLYTLWAEKHGLDAEVTVTKKEGAA